MDRKHRHISQVARALLFQSNLPISFWGECVLTVVYLINRLPTPFLSNITPFECLYHHPPSYNHLLFFGCLCYATIVQPKSIFESRANCCIFVGYSIGQKGYKLFDLETRKIFVSWDVKFHENTFPFKQNIPPIPPSLPYIYISSVGFLRSKHSEKFNFFGSTKLFGYLEIRKNWI